ncbi:phage protease [Polycladidibacter hongkongensis]|uniref:phage protease n=1 Tax=Polycladidibacter hongkongensis TaxID=1647556 RepID=UPI0008332F90|nr:phage protease [Pseudovibrio hongkongensis]
MNTKPHHLEATGIALALNRAEEKSAVPSMIELLPAGHLQGIDGREWLNSQPDAVIAAFNRQGNPLPVDYEHATHRNDGQSAPASGWINRLENRDGAIWGHVEWTEAANKMIAAREYRFISPVFTYSASTGQISALRSAALTNLPNLKLTALNKADSGDTPEARAHIPFETTLLPESTMNKDQRLALCRQLGLADEASDSAILQAVTKLQDDTKLAMNKAQQPDSKLFVPRADYEKVSSDLKEAQNKIDEAHHVSIEAEVDAAIKAGKIAPSSKGYHLAACKAEDGLKGFRELVGMQTSINTPGAGKKGEPDTKLALNKDQQSILVSLGVDLTDEKQKAAALADLKEAGAC